MGIICPQRVEKKIVTSTALTMSYTHLSLSSSHRVCLVGLLKATVLKLLSEGLTYPYTLGHTILKLETKHQSQQNYLMAFIWQNLEAEAINALNYSKDLYYGLSYALSYD